MHFFLMFMYVWHQLLSKCWYFIKFIKMLLENTEINVYLISISNCDTIRGYLLYFTDSFTKKEKTLNTNNKENSYYFSFVFYTHSHDINAIIVIVFRLKENSFLNTTFTYLYHEIHKKSYSCCLLLITIFLSCFSNFFFYNSEHMSLCFDTFIYAYYIHMSKSFSLFLFFCMLVIFSWIHIFNNQFSTLNSMRTNAPVIFFFRKYKTGLRKIFRSRVNKTSHINASILA